MKRITIAIGTKDRPTEIGLLLQSLRTNTFQNWDVLICDDASTTPIYNYYFLTTMFNRLKIEGHDVKVFRNNTSQGICAMRNQCAKLAIEKFPLNTHILRIDDDTIAEPTFLERLIEVLDEGYDLASGITPPMAGPDWGRETKFIEPIINRVVLDELGNFIINGDDCGFMYYDEKILPTHHFRSTSLYPISIHKDLDIWYETNLTMSGMREEEFFSFRCILKGLKLGVHTGAVHWHLQTPSGGHRPVAQDKHLQNQKILNRWVKAKVQEHGDFIQKYNERLGLSDKNKFSNLNKASNFIMTREE